LNTLVEALVDDSSAAAELELTAVSIEVNVRIVDLHLGHVRSQATRRVALRTFWDKHTTKYLVPSKRRPARTMGQWGLTRKCRADGTYCLARIQARAIVTMGFAPVATATITVIVVAGLTF
jgi:hypothetical protein